MPLFGIDITLEDQNPTERPNTIWTSLRHILEEAGFVLQTAPPVWGGDVPGDTEIISQPYPGITSVYDEDYRNGTSAIALFPPSSLFPLFGPMLGTPPFEMYSLNSPDLYARMIGAASGEEGWFWMYYEEADPSFHYHFACMFKLAPELGSVNEQQSQYGAFAVNSNTGNSSGGVLMFLPPTNGGSHPALGSASYYSAQQLGLMTVGGNWWRDGLIYQDVADFSSPMVSPVYPTAIFPSTSYGVGVFGQATPIYAASPHYALMEEIAPGLRCIRTPQSTNVRSFALRSPAVFDT